MERQTKVLMVGRFMNVECAKIFIPNLNINAPEPDYAMIVELDHC